MSALIRNKDWTAGVKEGAVYQVSAGLCMRSCLTGMDEDVSLKSGPAEDP